MGSPEVRAQSADTPGGVVVETRLERDLNRYRYEAVVGLDVRRGRWDFTGQQRFTSDAFEVFGGRLTFRDEVNAALLALRTWSPRTRLGVASRVQSFSQSRVLANETVALVQVQPRPGLSVEAEAGLVLDQRPGVAQPGEAGVLRTDAGPGGAVRFAFAPDAEHGTFEARGQAGWALLTPRRAGDARLSVTAERQFEGTRVGVQVLGTRLRRDAYQATSFLNRADARQAETIEATTSDTLFAALTLDAPLVGALRLTSDVDVQANARRVRTLRAEADALYFDTDFSRQSVAYEGALLAEGRGGVARLSVRLGAEAERRVLVNRDALPPVQAAQKRALLRQADFDRSVLATGLTVRGSRGALVAFADAAASILRHDTPDANPDDRDEAQQTASVGLQWRARPTLVLDVTTFASNYHTVYLKRERSGENNRQRSLRLRPAVTWRPRARTRVELGSEVRATYTVADRVLEGRATLDQSARELRHTLYAEHALAAPLRLNLRATRSDLRLGRLTRDRFAEIPYDTLRTYTLDASVQIARRITAEVGVRLFARRDSDRNLTVRYPRLDADGVPIVAQDGTPVMASISRPGRTWREQIGPTVRVVWPLGGASALQLDGWYAVQTLSYTLFGALPPADADRIRHVARRGQRDVFPNLTLTVRWKVW